MSQAATASSAQAGGSLFKLPKEVRLMVYERIFPSRQTNIWLFPSDSIARRKHKTCGVPSTSILSTCRAIHHEAAPVLSKCHHFNALVTFNSRFKGDLIKEWTEYRAEWLVVPTTAIHFLTLRIYLDPKFDLQKEYFERLFMKVKVAASLRRLHIKIECNSTLDQKLADKVMRILAEIECSAHVTGFLHPSFRSINIESSSYFSMLGKLGGTDTTNDELVQEIATLSQQRDQKLESLKAKTVEMMPQTINSMNALKERPQWDDEFLTRARGAVRSITDVLSETSALEKDIEVLANNIAPLERQLEALLKGRKMAITRLADEISALQCRYDSLLVGHRGLSDAA